jgi:hypothetical protein
MSKSDFMCTALCVLELKTRSIWPSLVLKSPDSPISGVFISETLSIISPHSIKYTARLVQSAMVAVRLKYKVHHLVVPILIVLFFFEV